MADRRSRRPRRDGGRRGCRRSTGGSSSSSRGRGYPGRRAGSKPPPGRCSERPGREGPGGPSGVSGGDRGGLRGGRRRDREPARFPQEIPRAQPVEDRVERVPSERHEATPLVHHIFRLHNGRCGSGRTVSPPLSPARCSVRFPSRATALGASGRGRSRAGPDPLSVHGIRLAVSCAGRPPRSASPPSQAPRAPILAGLSNRPP